MPEDAKKDSNYHWTRVNALRLALSSMDKMCKSFQVKGTQGSVRRIMACALLHESLCGAFMQAVECFLPHAEDVAHLEEVFKTNAEAALREVLEGSKKRETFITWRDVVGHDEKICDPYGVGKEGEDDE